MIMSDATHEARVQQLFACVYVHEHKDELIKLMEEQLLDDATFASVADATS